MTERRRDPLTGEWRTFATHRQDRTFLPPTDACPLCAGPHGEIPEAHPGEIVVFDNRFPSFTQVPPVPSVAATDLYEVEPAAGAAEVVVYSDRHDATLADLGPDGIERLVHVWSERYATLGARDEVEYVFIFENRGEAVGVTLHHPHGQIYAYPEIPPIARRELEAGRRHHDRTGTCVICDVVAAERADGARVVARNDSFLAFVPFAARFPYEVHVTARRHMPSLLDLSDLERRDFAELLHRVVGGYDHLFGFTLPYVMSMHQSPTDGGEWQDVAHLHVELTPLHRTADKLKYLAGSELGAGAFVVDAAPEETAAALRQAVTDVATGNWPDLTAVGRAMEPEQPTRPLWLDPPASPLPPSPPNPMPPDEAPASGSSGWLKPAIAGAVVGALVAAGVAGGIVAANDSAPVASVTRSSAKLAGEKLDVAGVLAEVEKGVVAIHVEGTQRTPLGLRRGEAAGSGMIIDEKGLVLTNAHVVSGATSIEVTLFDGRDVAADLVGADSANDVALIRLRETDDLTPVELGDSDELQVGDSVVAVGNALNLGATPTVTTGIVSALNRSIEADSVAFEDLIQTDAAINQGNSGGPLVNASGEVVGVNTAVARGENAQNIGFALSINNVKTIIARVRDGGGDQATAFLGVSSASVSDVSAAVRERLEIEGDSGAFVQEVVAGTAAEAAGLEVGDVIIKVGDDTIASAPELIEAIQSHEPGDKVRVTYRRGGETRTTMVTLRSKAEVGG